VYFILHLVVFNPLNVEINPICHLLALLGAHHILHVSRIRVKLLKILPLSAQYIYSLLMFVVNNRNLFLDNVDLYSVQTRNSYNLHPPLCHLTKYQKGVHYAGIRVFNQLPASIKSVANETKVFKKTLKRFLMDN
jgi:hypothetical protein